MILLLMGVSGSGKSTVGVALSQLTGVPFVDSDTLHSAANIAKMHAGVALTDADRAAWLDRVAAVIATASNDGQTLIVACSALKERYRVQLVAAGKDVRVVYLHGSPELLRSHLSGRRGHFFPPQLLQSQLDTLEEPVDALWLEIDQSPKQLAQAVATYYGLSS